MPCGKRSSRQRPHDAVSSSRVPSVESPLWLEPQNGGQVAQANHYGRRADGAEVAEEHGADVSGISRRRGVPAEDAIATGRFARLPEGHHPEPPPQCPTSLPPAPTATGCR